MNKKEYSFTYIQYKISNLMLIPFFKETEK